MQKHITKNTRVSRSTNRRRDTIRYVPIAPITTDVLLEHFFDYERRIAEIEDQLRKASAGSAIDIDSL